MLVCIPLIGIDTWLLYTEETGKDMTPEVEDMTPEVENMTPKVGDKNLAVDAMTPEVNDITPEVEGVLNTVFYGMLKMVRGLGM